MTTVPQNAAQEVERAIEQWREFCSCNIALAEKLEQIRGKTPSYILQSKKELQELNSIVNDFLKILEVHQIMAKWEDLIQRHRLLVTKLNKNIPRMVAMGMKDPEIARWLQRPKQEASS